MLVDAVVVLLVLVLGVAVVVVVGEVVENWVMVDVEVDCGVEEVEGDDDASVVVES